MSSSKQICYFNGTYQSVDETHIHPQDLGLTRGYGAFDFLQSRKGKPFRLRDHFERFARSADLLHLRFDLHFAEFAAVVDELVARNDVEDEFTVRCLLTGGFSRDAITIGEPNLVILLEPELIYPENLYTEGARIVTLEHQRELPHAKTLNYIPSIRLRNELKGRGITEVLYTFQGEVLEASTSNVFIVRGRTLITPKDNVLHGITRKVVLESAVGHFPTEERQVTIGEMKVCDEVFICSTSKEIVPVVKIDDWRVANGEVGPVTREMMEVFETYANGIE